MIGCSLSESFGWYFLSNIPKIIGMISSKEMVLNIDQKSRLTTVRMLAVGGWRLAQSARFKGVITMERELETAVRLTESAAFPLAIADIKLDMFPPGHAATSIIPKAKLAFG